ncbi:hypothetical protein BD408DRAFT_353504 [Parasitella parasitica]|nr:hypothetical protein BD408DRAFT_353504 [Parasitella parasitica]
MLCYIDDKPCTFCNIKENVGSRIVVEANLFAFKDRSPSARIHFLIIPKIHIDTVKKLDGSDVVLLENMLVLGKELLKQQGFNPDDNSQVR